MSAKSDASPSRRLDAAPDQARLDAVLETIGETFYALDVDWRYVIFNGAAEAYFGVARDEVLGRSMWEVFPQGLGTPFESACRQAMAGGPSTTFQTASRLRPDRTVELKIAPVRSGGVAVSLSDITQRKSAEDALRAERDRNAEILESISDAFYAMDEAWRFTYVNRVAERIWGLTRDDLLGKVLWEVFPQTVGSPSWDALHEAARDRKVVRWETPSQVLDSWLEVSAFPSGSGLSVHFRDITERKQAERRQQLLVNELNHRVKNSLAVVQALARQTLSGARSLAEAEAAFTARLLALAGAHDVITEENWAGASLHEVIARSVRAQLERPERLQVDGPPVTVSPKVALSLALAFHELLTNALKYGALSGSDGVIALRWRLEQSDGDRGLSLCWREQGGPPVSPPQHRGFGSRLIERALAADIGGTVRLRYAPDGVVCEIAAPLSDSDVFDPGI